MEHKIDSDLKCAKCQKIFESLPITLAPCGWVVCSHHIDSEEMKCLICPDQHELLKKNCISTKNIEIKYLRYRLDNSIKDLNKDLDNFKVIKKDPKNYINEYFNDIVNKVENRREKVKKSIDDYFDKMINNLKTVKEECESKAPSNSKLTLFNIEYLEKKLKELNHDLKREQSSLELHECVRKNTNAVSIFRSELKDIIDSLVDRKHYKLSPILPNIDYENLFGKIKQTKTQPISNDPNNSSIESKPKQRPVRPVSAMRRSLTHSTLNNYPSHPSQNKSIDDFNSANGPNSAFV